MISSTARDGRKIVTVTPNPALDITYGLPAIHLGQTHRVDAPLQRAGGKGLNVARVAHQTGSAVLAIAPVGGATGALFRAELEQSGLPHLLIPASRETRRSIAFVDEEHHQTSIFNERGEELPSAIWDEILAAVEAVLERKEASVLAASGSLPPNAPGSFYQDMIALAHHHKVPVIVDTSGPPLLDAAKAGADLLKPNQQELIEATGEPHLPTAARRLLQLGARTIIVSTGEKGMLAFTRDQPEAHWAASPNRTLTGNPTGAGDAAVAAAAVCLSDGADLPTLLRTASAWGSAAVLTTGAGEIAANYSDLQKEVLVTLQKDIPCH